MRTRVPTQKSDAILLRDLKALAVQECINTAEIVAHIAEAEERRLYLPAGYSSMHPYCVDELHLSDDAAYKRLQAARAAREFPPILDALASGRLHLTAVVLLRPNLNADNVEELVAAATHRTRAEIETLIANRFPKSDVPERLVPIGPAGWRPSTVGLECQGTAGRDGVALGPAQLVSEPVASIAARPEPTRSEPPMPRPKVTPLAPERFALQVTIGQSTRDKLRHAQELLSHRLPSGDIAQVIDLALDALVRQLEKQKFAATDRPRRNSSTRASANPRHIPAHVKRAVRERDQDQCTFVSDSGQRCGSRKLLEFDHVEPVARGGQATVDGIRLRCSGHNQYEADCTFGAGFMDRKREKAKHCIGRQPRLP